LDKELTSAFLTDVAGVGSIRTATKRAGGTISNHGGSPGKRLGVKKFSGAPLSDSIQAPISHSVLQMSMSFRATLL